MITDVPVLSFRRLPKDWCKNTALLSRSALCSVPLMRTQVFMDLGLRLPLNEPNIVRALEGNTHVFILRSFYRRGSLIPAKNF